MKSKTKIRRRPLDNRTPADISTIQTATTDIEKFQKLQDRYILFLDATNSYTG